MGSKLKITISGLQWKISVSWVETKSVRSIFEKNISDKNILSEWIYSKINENILFILL